MGVGDLALVWDPAAGGADLAIDAAADDLLSDEGLHTAILLSLFLDRRAEPDDVLPDGGTDRRGWWADEFAEVQGDQIGSRRWLLARSKRLASVLARDEQYSSEALEWLIEDRVASRVDVASEAQGETQALLVTVHRPGKDPVTFRFADVWEAEAAAVL